MKITKEVKIGVSSIIILFVAYWGITFLKGANILSSTNTYKAKYVNVNGLEVSSPVLINGMKVGAVINVKMNDVKDIITVFFTVKSEYKIPDNSIALLGNSSLLGGKAILLKIGDSDKYLKNNSIIESEIENGMMGSITDIAGKATTIIDSLTLTLSKINSLLSSQMINETQSTISNLNKSTKTLSGMLNDERGRIANITTNLGNLATDLNQVMPDVKGTMSNLNDLTDSLNNSLPALILQINEIILKVAKEDSTIGKLLNDSKLYDEATITLEEASKLLKDLKKNPKRYVQFSLFGKSDKNN